jgi:Putative adhesin
MTFMPMTAQPPVPPPERPGPLRMTRGRWAALAVAVPVALALIGWTGFSLVSSVARGSYPFSYEFPVQNRQVAVNLSAGDITLHQAPGSSAARLTGTVQYGLFRPAFSAFRASNGVNVNLDCSANINGNCGVSASLAVPPRTGVTLWSDGGNIAASDFSSGMTLWADGGDVNVSDLTGSLQLDTGGGDLTGNGLKGTLLVDTEGGDVDGGNWTGSGTMRMDTGGGDLSVNGLTGNFQLVTEGGNVDASGVIAATSTTQSGGGDVTLAFTQVPKSVSITAEGGNVTLILPPGNAKYAISTPETSGGNVSYPSSLVAPNSPHTITIDSGGGDITISQG